MDNFTSVHIRALLNNLIDYSNKRTNTKTYTFTHNRFQFPSDHQGVFKYIKQTHIKDKVHPITGHESTEGE